MCSLFHDDGSDDIYDLADLTPQCGRRGDALKLHLSWLYYGSEGYSSKIGTAFRRADKLYGALEATGNFTMVSTRPLPCLQVCFYYSPNGQIKGDAEEVSRTTAETVRLLVGKGFMIDYAPGEKGKFFRVVLSINTEEDTVDRLVQCLEEAGREVYP